MIKDFFVRIKGPHLFLSLIFLGLGVMVLAFGVKGYKEYSQREIKVTEAPARHDQNFSPEELQAMFGTSGDPAGNEFEVVAQQNLFSPDREAWTPPPANDQEEARPARTQRVNPKEFKLYGVTFAGEEKMALIHYQRLPESSRNRLVAEGETIYQERNGGEAVFRVASIGVESVTLEANGDSFEVGLFSHERQVVQSSGEDRISIAIGGTSQPVEPTQASAPGQPETRPASEHSEARPSEPGSGHVEAGTEGPAVTDTPDSEGTDQEASGDQPQARGLPELLQKMREGASQGGQAQDSGDMETRVQEGTMRKIDTPFGPIYRPVN